MKVKREVLIVDRQFTEQKNTNINSSNGNREGLRKTMIVDLELFTNTKKNLISGVLTNKTTVSEDYFGSYTMNGYTEGILYKGGKAHRSSACGMKA